MFRFDLEQCLLKARTLAQLNHPNILRVRHFFVANGTAYLVMDYYQGLSLAEYLYQRGGPLREDQANLLLVPTLRRPASRSCQGLPVPRPQTSEPLPGAPGNPVARAPPCLTSVPPAMPWASLATPCRPSFWRWRPSAAAGSGDMVNSQTS